MQLQGPSASNINSVTNDLQRRLRNINVGVNVSGHRQAVNNIARLRREVESTSAAAEQMGLTFGASLKRFAAFSVATRAVGLFTSKLASAVDEAIAFQNEVVRLSQVAGTSTKNLTGLTKQITKLSTTLGISSRELLDVSTTLVQAGLSAKDTEVALRALAKTALAPSFGNIMDTTEGAIAVMAQFQEGAGALERQLGAINQVAAKFAVESEDLISVIRRSGGVFRASGGSLEELLALFTSVRATTRESAESIATGLRTIFTRIQRPATIQYLKQLGIELTDIDGKFVGPYEAVRRLSSALTQFKPGDTKFIQVAEELGGFRQISKVIPLLQQFETAEKARQAAIEGGDSLTKDAAAAQESLAIQIKKVKEEFLALVRGLSETESFKLMITSSLQLASGLIKVADALKPIIPLMGAFLGLKIARGVGSFAAGIGNSLRRHNGGGVHHFARGGSVPGSGNRDTVPAMLMPGEFVIRKSSVDKIGAANLEAMNRNRFAIGGLVDEKNVAFATTEYSPSTIKGSATVTKNDIAKAYFGGQSLERIFGKELVNKALLSDAVLGNRRFNYSTTIEGLGKDDEQSFAQAFNVGVKSALKSAGDYVGERVLGGAKFNDNKISADFYQTFDKGFKGLLFENVIRGFNDQPLRGMDTQQPFDFTNGLGKFGKAYSEIGDTKYVDAKFSLYAARASGEFEKKIAAQLASEAFVPLQNISQRQKGTELRDNKSLSVGSEKRKRLLGFAKGGSPSGSDTVPAMLTPGEFVINKQAAQRIGYGNLSTMNRNGVAGFAAGGIVGGSGSGNGNGFGIAGLAIGLSTLSSIISSSVDSETELGKTMQQLNSSAIAVVGQLLFIRELSKTSSENQKKYADSLRTIAERDERRKGRLEDLGNSRKFLANKIPVAEKLRANIDRFEQKIESSEASKRRLQIQKDGAILSGDRGAAVSITREIINVNRAIRSYSTAVEDNRRVLSNLVPQLNAANKSIALYGKLATTTNAVFAKLGNGWSFINKSIAKLNDSAGLQRVGSTILGISVIGQQVADTLKARADEATKKAIETGNIRGAQASGADSVFFSSLSSIGSAGATGAGIGSLVGPLGTAIGGALGLAFGGFQAFTGFGAANAEKQKEISNALVDAQVTKFNEALTKFSEDKADPTTGKALNISEITDRAIKASATITEAAKSLSGEDLVKANEQRKALVTATAAGIGAKANTREELDRELQKFANQSKEAGDAARQAAESMFALKQAQEAVTKANLDQLRISSVFNNANLSVSTFLSSLETGASTIDNIMATIEAAEKNFGASAEGNKAVEAARQAVTRQLGPGAGGNVLQSVNRSFDSLGEIVRINDSLNKNLSGLDLAKNDPAKAKEQIEAAALASVGDNKAAQDIVQAAITKLEGKDLGKLDISSFIKDIQGQLAPLGDAAKSAIEGLNIHSKIMVDLAKKRKESEERYIEAQRQAIDLQLEAAKTFEEFGGAKLTAAQQLFARIGQFNVSARVAGVGSLGTGSAADISAVAQQIGERFADLQNQSIIGARNGRNAFGGAEGVGRDTRGDLQKANTQLIEFTKQRISIIKEEIDIIRKKNQLEKDSIERLLGGDVEGFIRGQQAAGAASAVRSGNQSLVSMFSPAALGEAFKNAQEQNLAPQELMKFATAAARSVGVFDQRSAQVLSGNTAEVIAKQLEGRQLADVLGQQGAQMANLEKMNLTANEVIINATEMRFNNSLGQQIGRANGLSRGGAVYASRGIFVPRGTDTVPAMLTPGEFVVNRNAVNKGNNLQILREINGGSNLQGNSQTGYYSNGGAVGGIGISSDMVNMLSSSLIGFSDAVRKLEQIKISVKIDPTNVNVNFNGTSFLATLRDDIKAELINEVRRQLPNLKQNMAGETTLNTGVLG